jgi:hypothetical protein
MKSFLSLCLFLALITATAWGAGNIALAAIGAPGIFAHAPPHAVLIERDTAGAIFGELLRRWSSVVKVGLLPVVAGLSLAAVIGLLSAQRRRSAATIAVLMLTLGVAHLWSHSVLQQTLAAAPPTMSESSATSATPNSTTTYTLEQRQIFNQLHVFSTRLYSTETFLLLLYVISIGVVLAVDPQPQRASATTPSR